MSRIVRSCYAQMSRIVSFVLFVRNDASYEAVLRIIADEHLKRLQFSACVHLYLYSWIALSYLVPGTWYLVQRTCHFGP